ncbi:MAG TPA: flagellin [Longimicrobiales bacterium]|nr:flagellin [Longimicrobiales bacterium]
MRINTNVSSLNTQRVLGQTNAAAAKQIGRLSSGFRINRAADDAAGLGIANKLRADVRSMLQAGRNAEQATSMLQVMEGATTQISSILERMKELATQANSASSGADNGAGKTQLQAEFTALRSELDRIVSTTTFNGQTLLAGGFGSKVNTAVGASTVLAAGTSVYGADINGTAAGTYTVTNAAAGTITIAKGGTSQSVAVGSDGAQDVEFSAFGITLKLDANYDAGADATVAGDLVVAATASGDFMVSSSAQYGGLDLVSFTAVDVDSTTLGISADTLATQSGAQTALANLDTAIGLVNTAVGKIGAAQNRLEYAFKNVQTAVENTAAAESTIRDADMAAEMTEFSRVQILQQAGTAMLAQANQAPQGILQLLR